MSDVDKNNLVNIVHAASSDALSDDDIAELAVRLAESGWTLPRDESAADVASSGGISSILTLLCPLQLRVHGLRVAKLGVAGRPAGGIDVLQTIPGFNAHLTIQQVTRALSSSGYVHLLADDHWAPLDARLFAYRQATGSQAVPALVIASLLAKKLATGTVAAGLEVRVAAHGNFGENFAAARRHAGRYLRVAKLLDLRPTCVLTDASQPYQPFIGRGESLLALWQVITGAADTWLAGHARICEQIAAAVAANAHPAGTGAAMSLREAQTALLQAHGASWEAFEWRAVAVRAAPRRDLVARQEGFVSYDLSAMRTVLVGRQRDEPSPSSGAPPDPAGVVLHAQPGQYVRAGEPVASLRAPEGEVDLVDRIERCVSVHPERAASQALTEIEIMDA